MRQINLLPEESKPQKRVKVAFKRTEKFLLMFLAVYLLLVGISSAVIYFYNNKLTELQNEKTVLSEELKSLTKVETSLVYIRDRVEKFNTLTDKDRELTGLQMLNDIDAALVGEDSLSDILVSDSSVTFAVNVASSGSFSNAIGVMSQLPGAKSLLLTSISYKEDGGYSFGVELNY